MKWFAPAFLLLFSFFINACVDKEPVLQEGIIGERILLNNDREYVDYLLAEIEKCKAAGTAYNFEDKDGKVVSNPDRRWLENVYLPQQETGDVQERACTEKVWSSITVTGTSGYAGGILRVFKSSTNYIRGTGMIFHNNTTATPGGNTTMSNNSVTWTCDGWCQDYRLALDGVPQPTSIVMTIFHRNNEGQICVTPVTVPNANVGFNSTLITSLCFCGAG